MFHNFIKIFTFIIFITSIHINLYADEEIYKDGKEWKELNLGLIESSKDGNISKVKELLNNISENVLFLKILGSYPIANLD